MLLSMLMLAAVAVMVREHWNCLSGEQLALLEQGSIKHFGDTQEASDRLLFKWCLRGVVIPLGIWSVENLGLFQWLPPLVPEIAYAQANDDPWFAHWMTSVIKGGGLIGLSWGAITYIWMAFVIAREAREYPEFKRIALKVGAPMFVLSLIIIIWDDWSMLPAGLLILFVPFVHCLVSIAQKPQPIPSYNIAEARIKFGKYEDAELEVISQLEKRETDFQGWMILAELYATQYQRFDDAAQVVVDMCADPTIQEVEISVACNKLADWQLDLAKNPPAARAALDLLIKSIPGTHFAHMARVRLQQMPRTREDLEDQKKRRAIRLPSLREQFDEPAAAAPDSGPVDPREATLEANRLGDRLRDNPNDHATRERLAILLAEKLDRLNLGTDQLRLIIKAPDAGAELAAKCLAQIANWERRLNKNEPKFRALLAEIIRDYPATSHALAARRQLKLIDEEALQAPPPPPRAPIRIRIPEAPEA